MQSTPRGHGVLYGADVLSADGEAEDAPVSGYLATAVSSGEALPLPVRQAWADATGLELAEVLGSTEMLHAFAGSAGQDIRPGFIGPGRYPALTSPSCRCWPHIAGQRDRAARGEGSDRMPVS